MWFFRSPQIVFGEHALDYLRQVEGQRAFIVTDETMVQMGFVALVEERLAEAGLETACFAEVEPDPSVETVERGAAQMRAFAPDWIIGLGGGSSMDAAKAMWILYERPDLDPRAITPFDHLGLRQKARMIAIPTTSGTGSEVTWAIVLTDTEEARKFGTGCPEVLPDLAIVDPHLAARMPPRLTADTGMDALTQCIEGYVSTWHNDFTDGLNLKGIQLIFEYLPRAYENPDDMEAREHMHNAATLSGLGYMNAMVGLAHAMGHALGAYFHVPHGRAVGLYLPYTIEFSVREGDTRYGEIARSLGLPAADEVEGARSLVQAIRDLARRIGQPLTIQELGLDAESYRARVPDLVTHSEEDASIVACPRQPTTEELHRLFECAYDGRPVDF